MNERTFRLVIGSMDDFESREALKATFRADPLNFEGKNASEFTFSVPNDHGVVIAEFALYGIAFKNGWCDDGTLSFFEEVLPNV